MKAACLIWPLDNDASLARDFRSGEAGEQKYEAQDGQNYDDDARYIHDASCPADDSLSILTHHSVRGLSLYCGAKREKATTRACTLRKLAWADSQSTAYGSGNSVMGAVEDVTRIGHDLQSRPWQAPRV